MVYFVTFPFRFSFRNVLVASFAMPEYELKEMRTFVVHKKKHLCTESSSVSPFVFVSSLEFPMETKRSFVNSVGTLGNNFTLTSLRFRPAHALIYTEGLERLRRRQHPTETLNPK